MHIRASIPYLRFTNCAVLITIMKVRGKLGSFVICKNCLCEKKSKEFWVCWGFLKPFGLNRLLNTPLGYCDRRMGSTGGIMCIFSRAANKIEVVFHLTQTQLQNVCRIVIHQLSKGPPMLEAPHTHIQYLHYGYCFT